MKIRHERIREAMNAWRFILVAVKRLYRLLSTRISPWA